MIGDVSRDEVNFHLKTSFHGFGNRIKICFEFEFDKNNTVMKFFAILTGLMLILLPFTAQAQDGYAGSWQLGLQDAAGPVKAEIDDFHHMLLIIITVITLAVTGLMAYAVVKFRRRKHVEPATFAHNTLIEVMWTILPVLILIVIAIPSFKILYFENRVPEPELTIKATGYQWYWGYEYMDYDGIEFLSYIIPDEEINTEEGQLRLLSTDNPVVVPINTNIQILTTAADVLHSFALPAAGVKKDAVPGQLNETWMRIDRPGTYYGQCSEICGTGHAYMPIEFRAVPRDEFDAWVGEQGGTLKVTDETEGETATTDGETVTGPQAEDGISSEDRNADPLEGQQQPVDNSQTENPDSEENKLENPKVDEDNVSNPGQ